MRTCGLASVGQYYKKKLGAGTRELTKVWEGAQFRGEVDLGVLSCPPGQLQRVPLAVAAVG